MSNDLIGVANNHVINIFRSAGTKRWTIVPMVRQQTLAEHHGLVASIVMYIIREMDIGSPAMRLSLLERALNHDLQEVVTGDMPTPGKKALGESIGTAINEVENDIRVMMGLGEGEDRFYGRTYTDILKAADNLEAMWFASTHAQCGVGLKALNDIAVRTAVIAEEWSPELRKVARSILAEIVKMVINDRAEEILMQLHSSLDDTGSTP